MESSDKKIKLEPNDEEFEERTKTENGLKEMECMDFTVASMDFTVASCSSNPRNIESETNERENVVKLEPEIKTEEGIKIKLEPTDEEDSQNELRELISEKEAVDPAPVINNEKVKVQFTFNFVLD